MAANDSGSFNRFLAGAAPKARHQDPPDPIAQLARKGCQTPAALSPSEIKALCEWVRAQTH